jgi:large subunit ribosomal protein L18
MEKKTARLRRARRARAKIREMGIHRLCVHRTPRHIYAQLYKPSSSEVVVSASSLDSEAKTSIKGNSGNINAASVVGSLIAMRARAAGISQVAFDRSGYKYHGRIKALADAAREQGLVF